MKRNDMDFFHQATKKICGSLNIHSVLDRCLKFLKNFIPLDSIGMNIYDPNTQSLVNVATTKSSGLIPIKSSIALPEKARQFIKEQTGKSVVILNHPEKHIVGQHIWKAFGKKKISEMVLPLEIENKGLGVIIFSAKGFDQYNSEHARLLNLLHDPFAMALANALKHQEVLRLKDLLADDNQYLNNQLHHISGDEIIGSNSGLKNVMEMVRQIAPLKSHALLIGETGAGKEVIANAIHYSSPRASGPFIKVNCGAIPENLIDSELFGHEKGAFTGAFTQKRGRFERANKGTLFLDEIGELPLQAQVRLLRVLQNKEIERVGGSQPIQVDIRIITATHRNLQEMIRKGKFREDLWFRLNVFPINIPPLRQRKSDIPALTRYFMERKAREMNFRKRPVLAPGAMEKLQAYNWPGNVRELENLVERTIILGMTGKLRKPLKFEELHPVSTNGIDQINFIPTPDLLPLNKAMKTHIRKALKMADGKVEGKDGAAAILEVNPSTLRNRMKKLGISYGRKGKSNANID
ncbi:sigma-54 interaction domain-containing protein [Desulfobacula phenolica]|uniref:Transcriptional regulator containing GAF, AAA-type ATPase, and DNA-binding Fis domains n=1 Tax=Desulfobacula phenolica TaxID=90732 RepID=A0A1H2IFA3_9BACT|nr:sigma 54-interacting transcriptional regulator [Desulfobacula phenolica]SDU42782.1 Transcriptional regulator containing GAF, AAA-type ATPase, and DNA-binding Fis domains [Desulfobacula phenolica]